MINFKKVICTACMMLLILTAGCSSSSAPASADTAGYSADVVRINYSANYGMVIPNIIHLKGFLDGKLPEGVTVEWSTLNTSTAIRDALISNHLDFAILDIAVAVTAIENDLPIVILGRETTLASYLYSANPEIKSLNDIKLGDKIASPNLGGSNRLALMLRSYELFGDYKKFDDNMIAMENPEILAALSSGNDIACALFKFPHTIAAGNMENVKMIDDLTQLSQENLLGSLGVVSKEFADNNPVIVAAYLEAVQEAMDFINENPYEAALLLSESYGIDVSDIEEYIKTAKLSREISESAYDNLTGAMYETGMLENPPKKLSDFPNYESLPKVP